MSAPPHDLTTTPTSAGTPAGDSILATVVKLLAEAIDEGDDLDVDQITGLTVGQLVDFIAAALRGDID